MIRNVVFDMGNVLILYDARRYVDTYIEDEEDRILVLEEFFGSVEWVRMDRGDITQEEALSSVCARLPSHLHGKVSFLLDYWHEDTPPFPEMETLVRELKDMGFGVYLLSNTSKKYHHFRRLLPAIEHFDGEFISADYGLLKPDPAIFKAFCEKFSLKAEECFFIDDAPANVEGAMHIGMEGFVYRRNVEKLRAALKAAGVEVAAQ